LLPQGQVEGETDHSYNGLSGGAMINFKAVTLSGTIYGFSYDVQKFLFAHAGNYFEVDGLGMKVLTGMLCSVK
jgi:hypothetical protein